MPLSFSRLSSPSRFSRIPAGLRAGLSGFLLLAGLLMGLAAAHPAQAQDRAGAAAPAASASATASAPRAGDPVQHSVDDLRKQLDAVPKKLDPDDDGRKRVNEVYAIGTAAEQLVAQRTEELADLDTRLAGLGPSPEKGAPADAPDVAQQRAGLAKQRAIVDADLKLARLIVVDADQRSADLVRQRRQQFQDALTARIDSPLGPTYWRALRNAWPSDTARLSMLAIEARQALERAMEPARRATFLASLAGALLLAVLGNWVAKRVLVRVAPTRLPSGRLRRSLLAAVSVVVHVLLIGLAAQLALSGIDVGDNLGERLHGLGSTAVRLAIFSSFAIGLGSALLSRRRSSWRLPSLSDDLARRLSPYPWWIAIVASTSGLVTEINTAVGASLAAEVTTQAVTALLVAFIAIACLRHLHSPPVANKGEHASGDQAAAADSTPAPNATPRPLWVGLLVACAGFASVATLVLVALGFVALASTLARQMVWSAIVFATAYLLYQLADDVCEAVLSSKGSFGRRLHSGMGIDASLLDQAAVLGSGVLRVVLFFYMVIGLMAPFGTGVDEVFRRGSSLNNGLQVGNFAFAPQALLTALAVIAAGFVGIRVLKRWLSDRYFPNTTLEPGMRSSIVSLLGYVGAVLVVAAALAALGISVERIAWVASALSVGIGFGLQAIVQNFISGLILLAERPVKVGDWVVLGDTEGDVRRVNVRATEIQLGDRSTVIVPNSEFITKTVRNMTLTGAPGRVLLRLPAPLDTDAQRMREVILQAFHAHEGIMDEPEPIVQLEGILNGTLTFLAIGYVSNPRNAGGVKSDLLFTILDNLRGAGLALSPPATTSLAHPTTASPTVTVPQPQGSNGPATTVV